MNTNRSTPPFTTQPTAGKLSARALIFVAVFALACGEALAQEQETTQHQHGDDISARYTITARGEVAVEGTGELVRYERLARRNAQ